MLVAYVCMVVAHMGLYLFPEWAGWFAPVNGVVVPVFACGIAQGYEMTSDVGRYANRLLVMAWVSQVVFWLLDTHRAYERFNILFNLWIGLQVLIGRWWLYPLSVLVEGDVWVPVMVLAFNRLSMEQAKVFVVWLSVVFLPMNKMMWMMMSVPFLGKFRGNVPKWVTYGLYPVHVVVLTVIGRLLQGR